MNDTEAEQSVSVISHIDAVSAILDVVCRTTGMGFAAVARVTEGRWIACSVKDDIAFALRPGEELKVETTICHEVCNTRKPVIISNVATDPVYRSHPTPTMYSFQSYISMPITLPDGTLFGTLCAIDSKQVQLNKPEIVGVFKFFAELLAYQIDTANRMTLHDADLVNERRIADCEKFSSRSWATICAIQSPPSPPAITSCSA